MSDFRATAIRWPTNLLYSLRFLPEEVAAGDSKIGLDNLNRLRL